MNFLTRILLLVTALSVSALLAYGQESKSKEGSTLPVGPPPAIEDNPSAWKEYSSPRGRFTITFPGTPVESDNPSGIAPRTEGRKYMLKTTAVYAVHYLDFAVEVSNKLEAERILRKPFLDGAGDVYAAAFKGKILSETATSIDGNPGRLIKIAQPDGTVIRAENYVVGTRVYQLLVVTPKELLAPDGGRFDESRATRFLDSFKLVKPAPAIEPNPDAWKVYSSTQGRFAIMFPGTPATEDHSYDTPLGRCDARTYIVMTFAAYRVDYTDFVVDFEQDPKKFNDMFDETRDTVVKDFKAKVFSETVISLDGHPGRTMTLLAPDGSITRNRTYAVGKRLYQVQVTTSKSFGGPDGFSFDESWATKFFDSFKLAKPE